MPYTCIMLGLLAINVTVYLYCTWGKLACSFPIFPPPLMCRCRWGVWVSVHVNTCVEGGPFHFKLVGRSAVGMFALSCHHKFWSLGWWFCLSGPKIKSKLSPKFQTWYKKNGGGCVWIKKNSGPGVDRNGGEQTENSGLRYWYCTPVNMFLCSHGWTEMEGFFFPLWWFESWFSIWQGRQCMPSNMESFILRCCGMKYCWCCSGLWKFQLPT